ncbi:MAG TPA: glycosyltransferase family 9 protein, partial [Desulfovibrio sp.]|nr:glycosyltransferase family 9 protein [Desulfovibrio sp.]
FTPSRIAVAAKRMIIEDRNSLQKMNMPGLRMSLTSRNANGLYSLQQLSGSRAQAGDLLGQFWQQYFGAIFGLWDVVGAENIWDDFAAQKPALAAKMATHLPRLGKEFSKGLARSAPLGDSFWNSCPLVLRQFTGFIHLFLQNNDYNRQSWIRVLSYYEQLAAIISRS